MPDLLHPGPAGYEIRAQQLEPYVRTYLPNDRTATPASADSERR